MGKWKFSPDQLASQEPIIFLDKIKVRSEKTKKTIKKIFEQTLKLVPTLIDAEVNKALKDNEKKMTLKFNTCLVLMKDIAYVVRNATNTWRNVYHLHKPSEKPMEIKDDDDDDNDKDEEDDEESTQFFIVDYQELMKDDEEGKEEEATEESKKDDEETDPIKVTMAIIASLPHSLAKLATSSSSKIASASLIVTTIDTSNV